MALDRDGAIVRLSSDPGLGVALVRAAIASSPGSCLSSVGGLLSLGRFERFSVFSLPFSSCPQCNLLWVGGAKVPRMVSYI